MEPPPTSDVLLAWSQEQTRGYRGVTITDLSASWKDGLALCALIHSLDKTLFEYEALLYLSQEEVVRTAFHHADSIGIPQLLGTSDLLVSSGLPDQTAVELYLLSIYHHWQQQQQQHRQEERMLAQQLLEKESKQEQQHQNQHQRQRPSQDPSQHASEGHRGGGGHGEQEVTMTRQISLLSEKNMHVGESLRESRQIKGLLVNVEEELTAIHNTIEQNVLQNELVKYQLSEKTAQLENTIEKERQQYEKEIEQLEKELGELRKQGPSAHQLALKRKLDEQCEKKDRLNKIKQQMENEISQLKQQLEQDEQQRIQLQARRVQAEQRRTDLRLKHKDELQRLQQDIADSFNAEDKVQTDLLQQNYVKNNLLSETNDLSVRVQSLDGVHTGIVKQNTELKKNKQKLEEQLLKAKLYLEEETRILNFKELGQSDLQQQKKQKADELEQRYDVKRTKERKHRKVATKLVGTKETYDDEYIQTKRIERDLSKLGLKSDHLRAEHDDELQRRPKKVEQIKDTNRIKIEKEDSRHREKVEAVASQMAALSANSQEAQQALSAEKAKIDEMRARADELSTETRSAVHSLTTEANSHREASRAQDNLKMALEQANKFLVGDKQTKTKTTRARQKAEDNLKSISEAVVLTDSKKSSLENTTDHLARDYELTKQDLKLAEKDARKAREEKQILGEEKERLTQDLALAAPRDNERTKPSPHADDVHTARGTKANAGTIEMLGQSPRSMLSDQTEALKREADDTALGTHTGHPHHHSAE